MSRLTPWEPHGVERYRFHLDFMIQIYLGASQATSFLRLHFCCRFHFRWNLYSVSSVNGVVANEALWFNYAFLLYEIVIIFTFFLRSSFNSSSSLFLHRRDNNRWNALCADSMHVFVFFDDCESLVNWRLVINRSKRIKISDAWKLIASTRRDCGLSLSVWPFDKLFPRI